MWEKLGGARESCVWGRSCVWELCPSIVGKVIRGGVHVGGTVWGNCSIMLYTLIMQHCIIDDVCMCVCTNCMFSGVLYLLDS